MNGNSEHTRVAIRHRAGALALDLQFSLSAYWTVLFGASGSGKTTVLRTIAGFVSPDDGRIVRQGRTLFDRATHVSVAPHLRGVRSAAQVAKLFPHMTVRENVAWGVQGVSPENAGGVIKEVLALFHVEQLTEQRPEAISGGQRQRVSVARAVASAVTMAQPPGVSALLLLDEPFTGLDLALRDRLALDLRDWLAARAVPVLSVTHDVGEAFLLGAEVIRLEDGCVTNQGPAERVLVQERERLLHQLEVR